MQIHFLTIFPEILDSYLGTSIMKRAQESGAVSFMAHNMRDFSTDKHHNVDAPPCGGGAGMVMQVEPIHRAVEDVVATSAVNDIKKRRIILLSAKGKRYTQSDAQRFTQYEELIFICGRYEGVDERVAQHIADEELAIGQYVLTGGELGAMVIADSVVRLLPGVLGNDVSVVHESHSREGYREHPQYAKPETYNAWSVPEVLLSGDHAAIAAWRHDNAHQSNAVNDKERS